MNSKLSRFDKILISYFLYMSPIIIGFMIWATIKGFDNMKTNGLGWDIFGWLFIAWILDLLYIITKMLFSTTMRLNVMTKLAGLKERDEREVEVAGNAAKFSFLSTLALLIFLFIFSVTNLTITKHPKNEKGKQGRAEIGFALKTHDDSALVHTKENDVETFAYKGFPLTKPMIILILIFWQIGSYQLVARRELKE